MNIHADTTKLRDFCLKHHIKRLAVFGSALRNDFRPDSDLDILVEFESGYIPGLAFFSMQNELSEIVGRRVDLNTPAFLSRHFRDEVTSEAQDIYVAA